MNFSNDYYHHETHRPAVGYDSLDGKLRTASFHPAPVAYQRFDTQIEATDVLCGRGKTSFNHGECNNPFNLSFSTVYAIFSS